MAADTTSAASRILRTEAEIFAAGFEASKQSPPLTDRQVEQLAAIFAPVLNAPAKAERRAA